MCKNTQVLVITMESNYLSIAADAFVHVVTDILIGSI